ncbi:MAG: YkgJ family cysteine cluster protein [Candidatus Gastranaerophilales bacterium]|nr:YkgJ family cysteine cluster protein [Candidatus Gastranaerophilales bacterium]
MDKFIGYLNFLQNNLNKFYEQQSPYIACQRGCCLCCKNAQFPFSEMEFNYLIQGSLTLSKEVQNKIEENIAKVIKDKKEFNGETFKYDCPFLIDNVCSVYEYRGIVCRTFGLIEENGDKAKIPFCHEEGLNYSNVVDKEKNTISQEKYLALNEENLPLAYNINYNLLTSKKVEQEFGFKFGDKKPLIDWFSE